MIKGFFQLIFGLIRLTFFLAIFCLIFHTWAIKQALKFGLSYNLGADVSIQEVKMDWKNTGFEVRGLEIGNPSSFPQGTLAKIPLLIVSMDMSGLTQGIIHLKAVGFDLRELQVMNAAQHGLNILDLKPMKKNKEAESSSREADRSSPRGSAPKVIIDELVFSVGDISYQDMSGSSLRQSRYHAGIRGATYYDLRSVNDVTVIVVSEALKKMGFGYLEAQLRKIQGRYVASTSKPEGFLDRTVAAIKQKLSE